MMTTTGMQYARASAAAIAAVMALSPTYAAPPKPVVDLSASPALKDDASAPKQQAAKPKPTVMGIDERTLEYGGGAVALLALGAIAMGLRSRKRRREDEAAWQYDEEPAPEARADEPLVLSDRKVAEEQPPIVAPDVSAFAWGGEQRREAAGSDCEDLDSWIDRAKCGPTPDNPSQSLKKRMKRAAFFEKRDREVAAGEAAPVDPDAGLPESLEETA